VKPLVLDQNLAQQAVGRGKADAGLDLKFMNCIVLFWDLFNAFILWNIKAVVFDLGRLARPGRQTGIRLYRPVPAEGQNISWGHRLTAKAITYQGRHQNNK
jgi:hypothetical protein